MLAITCSKIRATAGGGGGALPKRLISSTGPPAFMHICVSVEQSLKRVRGRVCLSCWFQAPPSLLQLCPPVASEHQIRSGELRVQTCGKSPQFTRALQASAVSRAARKSLPFANANWRASWAKPGMSKGRVGSEATAPRRRAAARGGQSSSMTVPGFTEQSDVSEVRAAWRRAITC
jgi:hypothetical protein